MKQTLKMLLSLVIVAVLMVSALAFPVFAAPDNGTEPDDPNQQITYKESEKLELVKNYLMPKDLDIYNMSFDLEALRKNFTGDENTVDLKDMDDDELLEQLQLTFQKIWGFPWKIRLISYNGSTDIPSDISQEFEGYKYYHGFPYGSDYWTEGNYFYNGIRQLYDVEKTTVVAEDGTKNVKVTIDDYFRNHNDHSDGFRYPAPGQYVFEINEYTDTDNDNEYKRYKEVLQSMGFDLKTSEAKYRIYLNVATQLDDDGKAVYNENGLIVYYVDNIVIEVITPDNESQTAGDKVDNVTFTNSIVQKPVDVDPEDPDTFDKTLVLKKEVTGKYGDYSKEFAFDFKIDKPDVPAAEATTAKATKIDRNGNKLGVEEFTYGQNKEVKLKAGETLVFTDVYYGATWSFDEQGVTNGKHTDGYTVTQAIKSGGEDADPADGEYTVKADGENSHTVTNDLSEIETPTGVLIDNLPYIIIFAITAGGILLFFVMKRRRRRDEE